MVTAYYWAIWMASGLLRWRPWRFLPRHLWCSVVLTPCSAVIVPGPLALPLLILQSFLRGQEHWKGWPGCGSLWAEEDWGFLLATVEYVCLAHFSIVESVLVQQLRHRQWWPICMVLLGVLQVKDRYTMLSYRKAVSREVGGIVP